MGINFLNMSLFLSSFFAVLIITLFIAKSVLSAIDLLSEQ